MANRCKADLKPKWNNTNLTKDSKGVSDSDGYTMPGIGLVMYIVKRPRNLKTKQ